MISWLLNLVYLALLAVMFPYFAWQAYSKGKYREGLAAKFLGLVPPRASAAPCVWLHAVSVGEVNLLRPLVARIAKRRPDWEIVISTTTMTGFALARTRYPEWTVCYCPLDFSWAAGRAFRRIRPRLLVLAELELWPNLIRAAKEHGASVAVVNGRLGERSFRGYRRIGWLVAPLLRRLDLIAVQNETYARRFLQLGARPERVQVTGSLKFDEAQTDRDNPATRELACLAGITPDQQVFLAGSTQHPEEQAALAAYLAVRKTHPELRLILVPRHPDRFEAVAGLLAGSGVTWRRRSELRPVDAPPVVEPPVDALLIDVVGELGAWWGLADVAFVGGSFGARGGQNMLEPAAYGAAVSFGPNTWNFQDIVDSLLAAEAAHVVRDSAELTAFLRRALDDPAWSAELGRRARELVLSQLGAADRTIEMLEALLEPPANLRSALAA